VTNLRNKSVPAEREIEFRVELFNDSLPSSRDFINSESVVALLCLINSIKDSIAAIGIGMS